MQFTTLTPSLKKGLDEVDRFIFKTVFANKSDK